MQVLMFMLMHRLGMHFNVHGQGEFAFGFGFHFADFKRMEEDRMTAVS